MASRFTERIGNVQKVRHVRFQNQRIRNCSPQEFSSSLTEEERCLDDNSLTTQELSVLTPRIPQEDGKDSLGGLAHHKRVQGNYMPHLLNDTKKLNLKLNMIW